MPNPEIVKAVGVTAQIFGRDITPDALFVYASDLDGYPVEAVLNALTRCRRELPRFPSLADVIARIDDGRPGPEEAWAMIPKDEECSVVWTEEMREAFAVCRDLLGQDSIAGRKAFLETYTRLLADARARRIPVAWSPSLGLDKGQRDRAIQDAAAKGRLSQHQVRALLPEFVAPKTRAMLLEGPREPSSQGLDAIDVEQFLADLRNRLSQRET